jgi:sugar phosphate permease
MSNPKLAFGLTFITYSIIHSVRTGLSVMKVSLQKPPLSFDTQFLGELDMTVLICLAISLKTLGWIGEKIGYKLFLMLGMGYLAIVILIMSILQLH